MIILRGGISKMSYYIYEYLEDAMDVDIIIGGMFSIFERNILLINCKIIVNINAILSNVKT